MLPLGRPQVDDMKSARVKPVDAASPVVMNAEDGFGSTKGTNDSDAGTHSGHAGQHQSLRESFGRARPRMCMARISNSQTHGNCSRRHRLPSKTCYDSKGWEQTAGRPTTKHNSELEPMPLQPRAWSCKPEKLPVNRCPRTAELNRTLYQHAMQAHSSTIGRFRAFTLPQSEMQEIIMGLWRTPS